MLKTVLICLLAMSVTALDALAQSTIEPVVIQSFFAPSKKFGSPAEYLEFFNPSRLPTWSQIYSSKNYIQDTQMIGAVFFRLLSRHQATFFSLNPTPAEIRTYLSIPSIFGRGQLHEMPSRTAYLGWLSKALNQAQTKTKTYADFFEVARFQALNEANAEAMKSSFILNGISTGKRGRLDPKVLFDFVSQHDIYFQLLNRQGLSRAILSLYWSFFGAPREIGHNFTELDRSRPDFFPTHQEFAQRSIEWLTNDELGPKRWDGRSPENSPFGRYRGTEKELKAESTKFEALLWKILSHSLEDGIEINPESLPPGQLEKLVQKAAQSNQELLFQSSTTQALISVRPKPTRWERWVSWCSTTFTAR